MLEFQKMADLVNLGAEVLKFETDVLGFSAQVLRFKAEVFWCITFVMFR
jgi:hypothetical protein